MSFGHNVTVFVVASKCPLLVFGLIFLSFLFICNKHHVLLISVHCILHDYPHLAQAFAEVVFFFTSSLSQIQSGASFVTSLETHERFLKARLVPLLAV